MLPRGAAHSGASFRRELHARCAEGPISDCRFDFLEFVELVEFFELWRCF